MTRGQWEDLASFIRSLADTDDHANRGGFIVEAPIDCVPLVPPARASAQLPSYTWLEQNIGKVLASLESFEGDPRPEWVEDPR